MSTIDDRPVWADAERPVLSRDWMRDGNAFALLGQAIKAQRKAGWTENQRSAWHTEATSNDYDHLLRTIITWHDLPGDDDEDWEDD